eukprot:1721655-Amphidinium_carterae.2
MAMPQRGAGSMVIARTRCPSYQSPVSCAWMARLRNKARGFVLSTQAVMTQNMIKIGRVFLFGHFTQQLVINDHGLCSVVVLGHTKSYAEMHSRIVGPTSRAIEVGPGSDRGPHVVKMDYIHGSRGHGAYRTVSLRSEGKVAVYSGGGFLGHNCGGLVRKLCAAVCTLR